jgi:hypothetical protein
VATIRLINGTGTGWIEVRGTIPAEGIGLFRQKGDGTWVVVHLESGQRFGGFGFPTKERGLEYIDAVRTMTDWTKPVSDIPHDVFLEAAHLRTKMMDSHYESMKPSRTLDT